MLLNIYGSPQAFWSKSGSNHAGKLVTKKLPRKTPACKWVLLCIYTCMVDRVAALSIFKIRSCSVLLGQRLANLEREKPAAGLMIKVEVEICKRKLWWFPSTFHLSLVCRSSPPLHSMAMAGLLYAYHLVVIESQTHSPYNNKKQGGSYGWKAILF